MITSNLIMLLGTASLTSSAFATTVIEPAPHDTQIFNQNGGPDYHWSDAKWALFGSYVDINNGYPMIQFDLSAIPASISPTTEVTLKMTESGAFGGHHQYRAHIYAVTESWDSNTVTWNSRDSTTSWATPGGSIDFSKDWASTTFESAGGDYKQDVYFNVTNLVNAWRDETLENNGFVVFPEVLSIYPGGSINNNYTSFGLSGAEAASRPALIFGSVSNPDLILRPVPEPETYAMLLAGLGLLGFMARRRKESAV